MIKNFGKTKKNDSKFLILIIVGFLLTAWFCTPPGNKILQVCFWGNNTQLFIAKIFRNDEANEYKFYRNNAIYLAKMYSNQKAALKEIDKAIKMYPVYGNDSELKNMYKDRAIIKTKAGDFKGALNDYINSEDIQFNDYLRVAMLFKEVGNYRESISFCNQILSVDSTAYAGYACLSDLYSSIGRYDIALNVWNLAIDRKPNNPRAYADRAKIKKALGDLEGYNTDMDKAKSYAPTMDFDESITYEAIHPKMIMLSVK